MREVSSGIANLAAGLGEAQLAEQVRKTGPQFRCGLGAFQFPRCFADGNLIAQHGRLAGQRQADVSVELGELRIAHLGHDDPGKSAAENGN